MKNKKRGVLKKRSVWKSQPLQRNYIKNGQKKKYFDFGDGKVHDDIIHRSGGGRVWSKGVELVQVNSTFNKLE